MKHLYKIIFLLIVTMLYGCQSDEFKTTPQQHSPTPKNHDMANSHIEKGVVHIKLTSREGDNIEVTRTSGQVRSGSANIDNYLQQLGATSMKRVFPHAGKYEERTRKAGLHLWYEVRFDENNTTTRATAAAKKTPGIEIVEEVYKTELLPHSIKGKAEAGSSQKPEMPFNDPLLPSQWHYTNFAQAPQSIAGADISLFPAWKKEVGNPSVIVCIVDEGVDFNHEDLKDNIWVNMAELNGQAGVDDDGNGYVDDIYGFNFVTEKGTINPGDHGTHVAGTIAARNNNGIGVCGIAGGDGSPSSGVRLMSCQKFMGESGSSPQATSRAIKYGADNGAVISQNSWGYRYPGPPALPKIDKEAIDYFIKYAGCDNNGAQLPGSLMKGGVVIFAAGNDGKIHNQYPASYPPVISVSAMAPDFKATSYTNKGSWVSVMAPGGESRYGRESSVLSTLTGNKYGWMDGTSMACPHVSGVAALAISKFGGPGFTNDMLKERVLTSMKPEDINKKNKALRGLLGRGYIDAGKALSINNVKAPGKIENIQTVPSVISINVSWTAVSDEDDGTADKYLLYLSQQKLDKSNYSTAADTIHQINAFIYPSGKTVEHTVNRLIVGTSYYFALVAKDRWGLESPMEFFSAKTLNNNPPEKIKLLPHEPGFIDITLNWEAVTDTDDGTAALYRLFYSKKELNNNNYHTEGKQVMIDGTAFNAGDKISIKIEELELHTPYYFVLRAEDRWGQPSPTEFFSVSTLENHKPELTREDDKSIRIAGREKAQVIVRVNEPDKQAWKFVVSGQRSGVSAKKTDKGDGVLIDFMAVAPIGEHKIKLTVTDIFNASATLEIPFEVYKNEAPKVVKTFETLFIPENKAIEAINLSEYFSDPNSWQTLTFTARSSDEAIAGVKINGAKMTLAGNARGAANVEVTATDTHGAKTKTHVNVRVVKDDLVYTVYPIPATKTLNVRLSDEVRQATISIRSGNGNRVLTESVTPTTPAERLVALNVSTLSGGTYTLHVDANGKTYRQSFIKY